MNNYRPEERKIRMSDYVWRIVSKWRLILLTAIIFAILFSAMKYVKDIRTIKNSNEVMDVVDKESIEKQISALSDADKSDAEIAIGYIDSLYERKQYMENAAVMQLNPYDVPRMIMQYHIESEKYASELISAYNNVVTSDEVKQKIGEIEGFADKDIKDMITANNNIFESGSNMVKKDVSISGQDNTVLYVTVRGLNKEDVEKLTDIVKDAMESEKADLETKYGNYQIKLVNETFQTGRDAYVSDLQNAVYDYIYNFSDRLSNLKGDMSSTASAVVESYEGAKFSEASAENIGTEETEKPVSASASISKKWVFLGFVLGVMLICLAEGLCWLFGGKLNSVEEFKQNFDVRVLGIIEDKNKSKLFKIIDKWIYLIRNRNKKILTNQQQMNMILSNIRIYSKKYGVHTVYVSGTEIEQDKLQNIIGQLKSGLQEEVSIIGGECITSSPEALNNAVECKTVLFLEEVLKSKYQEIERELMACAEQEITVLGCIICKPMFI